MKTNLKLAASSAVCLAILLCGLPARAEVIFSRVSQYHNIQVRDEEGIRMLSFDGSWETRMSIADPLTGHFEYTEYFQMPFLWNHDIKRVLMAGLGGGSTVRAYQHYFTNVMLDTVELDPAVVDVAEKYFHVAESPTHHIYTNDARIYLKRTTNVYDVILMDAYSTTRYGSSMPPQLTTKEFFQIASDRLSTNGILAYNIIGQLEGDRENLMGAMFKTMKSVFPQVYLFPAVETQNVVMIGTKMKEQYSWAKAQQEGQALIKSGKIKLPTFDVRMKSFMYRPPPTAARSIVLTDDFCPIESLMQGGN